MSRGGPRRAGLRCTARRWLGVAATAAVLAIVSACAALPDVHRSSTVAAPSAVPAISASGPIRLTPAMRAQLARRWTRAGDQKELAALEEAATGMPLIVGNRVTLLFDGPQTMTAMLKAINEATDHINLETYIFDQDALGMQFADALIARQRAGVTVNIMYDSVGTLGVPQAFFERMRAAGIRLVAFNPVNPARLRGDAWKINNRDHRKVLIVDGKIAFTGGINISAAYANSSLFRSKSKVVVDQAQLGWRDTHVRVEGPAVWAFQWAFLQAWAGQDTADLPDRAYFPKQIALGDKAVRVIASQPGGGFEIYKAYILAMQQARRSIHLTAAYFVPDPQTLAALTDAARRGVDVRIVLPGVSDSSMVYYAGRRFYAPLLEAGVKIYQLRSAVLHAKTAVIDGNWSTVGSTNIDMRSFLHNSELNVVVLGQDFGRDMERAFSDDMRDSDEVTLEAWQRRPVSERAKEWAARVMDYWL